LEVPHGGWNLPGQEAGMPGLQEEPGCTRAVTHLRTSRELLEDRSRLGILAGAH